MASVMAKWSAVRETMPRIAGSHSNYGKFISIKKLVNFSNCVRSSTGKLLNFNLRGELAVLYSQEVPLWNAISDYPTIEASFKGGHLPLWRPQSILEPSKLASDSTVREWASKGYISKSCWTVRRGPNRTDCPSRGPWP